MNKTFKLALKAYSIGLWILVIIECDIIGIIIELVKLMCLI